MPFRIGLSGLNAAQADLKVTSNNIANVSTIGFKQSRAEFANVFATSKGGSVQTAIGSGVRLASTAQQFTQGNLIFTENNLDLAITGDGFFSLNDTSGNAVYTRNGQFKVDGDGFVVDNSGSRVQAYGVDTVTNQINTGVVKDLEIIATNIAPAATTTSAFIANIDSREAIPTVSFSMDANGTVDPASYNHTTSFTSFDSLGNEMQTSLYFRKTNTGAWDVGIKQIDANGNIFQNMDATETLKNVANIPQIIYTPNSEAVTTSAGSGAVGVAASAADGAGVIRKAAIDAGTTIAEADLMAAAYVTDYIANYTTAENYPEAASNTAANTAAITAAKAASPDPSTSGALKVDIDAAVDAASATAQANALSPTETITFLNNGTLDIATVGATGVGKLTHEFNLSSITDNVIINPVMDPNGGTLQNQSILIDLSDLTQYGANFGITNLTQNGYTTGQLSGIEIDQSGVVLARFTNGQSNNLGQVFLTNFTNNQGLSQLGNNYWGESLSSGQGVVNVPGSGNAGLINSGANEDSNVDLTAQLINLITAQRNFQANAKTITTANQVTQTLLQI